MQHYPVYLIVVCVVMAYYDHYIEDWLKSVEFPYMDKPVLHRLYWPTVLDYWTLADRHYCPITCSDILISMDELAINMRQHW